MKKLLILFLTTISSISFTNDYINLKLQEKPRHVQTYDWCVQKADEFVREKRQVILNLLNIKNEYQWEDTKTNLEFLYKETIIHNQCHKSKKILPEYIQQSILNIIKHPYAQRKLQITSIKNENGIIVAERANTLPIRFLRFFSDDPTEPSPEASTDGYNITISPEAISNKFSTAMIEAFIGHELGHITCKHIIEKDCFDRAYEEQIMTKPKASRIIFIREFQSAMTQWSKAIESQADIVGTFNNWTWTNNLKTFFTDYISDSETRVNHPTPTQRFSYLSDMCLSIQKDSEPIKINKSENKTEQVKKPKTKSSKTTSQTKKILNTTKNTIQKIPQLYSKTITWFKSLRNKTTTKNIIIYSGLFLALYSFFYR